MIAVGEWLFGLTPFGWRFSVALIGSLSILMLARIVRRMTRSTLLGCVAGLLMALDGLELVLRRTAILDIFVMFWVLAAFGLVVIDRDRTRARLAAAAAARDAGQDSDDGVGPKLGMRWLLVAGRGLPGRGCRVQVERRVVHRRVRRAGHPLGSRRPPRRGLPGALARGAPQRRAVAAAVVRGAARRRLHRLVDRLVRHSLRLRPQRRRASTTASRRPRSRPGWSTTSGRSSSASDSISPRPTSRIRWTG